MSAQEYYQDRTMPAPEAEQGPAVSWETAPSNAAIQEQLVTGGLCGPAVGSNSERLESVGLAHPSVGGGPAVESVESSSTEAGPVGLVGSSLQGNAAVGRGTEPSTTGGLFSGFPDIGPALGGPFQREGGFGEGKIDLQLFGNGPYLNLSRDEDGGVVIGGGLYRSREGEKSTDALFGSLKIGTEHGGLGVEANGGVFRSKDKGGHLNVFTGGWKAGHTEDGGGFEAYGTAVGGKSGNHQFDLASYKSKFGKYRDENGNSTWGASLGGESGYTYSDESGREFKVGASLGAGPSYSPGQGFTLGGSLGGGVSYAENNKATGEYRKYGLSKGPSGGARAGWGDSNSFGFDWGPISYDRRSPKAKGPIDPLQDDNVLPVTDPR